MAIRGRGEAMENAGDGLKGIDSGAWIGAAGNAFRDAFSYEPGRWFAAGDAFEATATALSGYTCTLRWAQGQAADAAWLWDQGEYATQRARDAHDRAVAEAQARSSPGEPAAVPPFSDPGEAMRQAARDILNGARQQLTEAGDRAATVIRAEGDKAPEQSGWDAFWDGAGDVLGFVGDVGLGLWDGLSGTAQFLWELSPHHLIGDPDHYAEMWDGLTAAVTFAVENPLEFGKEIINWDQWSEEPGRALGNTLFAFIPVAGVVAKIRKLRRLSGARPALNRLGREYPSVLDPRTGKPIPFPGEGLTRVPLTQRVPWGARERGDYIAEWYARGNKEPEGGWAQYDIHHIQPREYDGTNDFDNLVPVPRTVHQREFNVWWRNY